LLAPSVHESSNHDRSEQYRCRYRWEERAHYRNWKVNRHWKEEAATNGARATPAHHSAKGDCSQQRVEPKNERPLQNRYQYKRRCLVRKEDCDGVNLINDLATLPNEDAPIADLVEDDDG